MATDSISEEPVLLGRAWVESYAGPAQIYFQMISKALKL